MSRLSVAQDLSNLMSFFQLTMVAFFIIEVCSSMSTIELKIPYWVQVFLGGMKSRSSAMVTPWIALCLVGIAVIGLLFLSPESYRLTKNSSFYFFLLISLGSYLAVRWVDRNDRWDQVSQSRVTMVARLGQVGLLLVMIGLYEFFS